MLQGHRVVLKGGVAVGLGRVAGVAGLGEQGQVRQAKPSHQVAALPCGPVQATPGKGGMEEGRRRRQGKGQQGDQGQVTPGPVAPGHGCA